MTGSLQRHLQRMQAEEYSASAFMGLGGAIWTVVALAALGEGNRSAFYGFGTVAAVCTLLFVVGLNHPRAAAPATVAVIEALLIWGLVMGWEPAVWAMVGFSVITPSAVACALYFAACREMNFVERRLEPFVSKGMHA